MCEGNQTWTLPKMDGFKIADFTIRKQGDAKGKLFFFLRAPYQVGFGFLNNLKNCGDIFANVGTFPKNFRIF